MTRQNKQQAPHKGISAITSILYFAVSLLFAAAFLSSSAYAIENEEELNGISSLQGPVTALDNAVDGIEILETYCTDKEPKKVTTLRRLLDLQRIAQQHLNRTGPLVVQMKKVLSTSLGSQYTDAARNLFKIHNQLIRIKIKISGKIDKLHAANEKKCALLITPNTGGTGVHVPQNPEETFQIHSPNYHPVGTPTFGTPFCTQGEKDNALLAIAREKSNAGHNLNQADQVVWSIKAALKTAQTPDGIVKLQGMLNTAKQEVTTRDKELKKLEDLSAATKKLPVEDCTNGAGNALGMPTIGLSAHRDLGTKVYAPNLKKYELPTLKACYDNETERQRAAWEAQKAGSNALHNHYEWKKRRQSIEDAMFKGEGNQKALKAAQKEAIVEAKKWDDKNKKADELAKEADEKPLCPKSQDNRTSMNAPSNNQKLLDSLRSMTGATPWEEDLGVIVPPVYTGDFDAADAASRGQNQAEGNMHRANRNERGGTAYNNGGRPDHKTTAPANSGNSSTLGSLVEAIENRKQPGKSEPELRINQGMAIDTQGRQIILPSSQPIDIDPSAGMPGTQNVPWPGATTTRNTGMKTEVQPAQNNQTTKYKVGNPNLTTQRAGTNVEVQQEMSGRTNNTDGTWVQVAPPTLVIPASPQN